VKQPLVWRKSRYSGGHGECVEVAAGPDSARLVRDSKDPDGPVLRFSVADWQRFTADLKR
jgi:hypothetical protein